MRRMLDTNTVSYIVRGHVPALRRLGALSVHAFCVSSITVAELLYGLARGPLSSRLQLGVTEFLRRAEVLPFGAKEAETFASMRAELTRRGLTLSPLDLLIAAHALTVPAILVSSDQAMLKVSGLRVEDWLT